MQNDTFIAKEKFEWALSQIYSVMYTVEVFIYNDKVILFSGDTKEGDEFGIIAEGFTEFSCYCFSHQYERSSYCLDPNFLVWDIFSFDPAEGRFYLISKEFECIVRTRWKDWNFKGRLQISDKSITGTGNCGKWNLYMDMSNRNFEEDMIELNKVSQVYHILKNEEGKYYFLESCPQTKATR